MNVATKDPFVVIGSIGFRPQKPQRYLKLMKYPPPALIQNLPNEISPSFDVECETYRCEMATLYDRDFPILKRKGVMIQLKPLQDIKPLYDFGLKLVCELNWGDEEFQRDIIKEAVSGGEKN